MPSREGGQPLEEQVLGAGGKTPPLARNRQPAAGLEHTMRLAQPIAGIGQVRERVAHGHEVERLRPEDQAFGGHAQELGVLALLRTSDREHAIRQVDSDYRTGAHLGRHQVRDQAGAGADVEGVLPLLGLDQLDQPGGDPDVLAACPAVVNGGDLVEEIDQVVGHLVGRVWIHQRHGSMPWASTNAGIPVASFAN